MLRNCDGCTVLCFVCNAAPTLSICFLCQERDGGMDVWDLLFSGAHVRGIIYLSSFNGDTTQGGPRLVGCGDVFTHFLITVSFHYY